MKEYLKGWILQPDSILGMYNRSAHDACEIEGAPSIRVAGFAKLCEDLWVQGPRLPLRGPPCSGCIVMLSTFIVFISASVRICLGNIVDCIHPVKEVDFQCDSSKFAILHSHCVKLHVAKDVPVQG